MAQPNPERFWNSTNPTQAELSFQSGLRQILFCLSIAGLFIGSVVVNSSVFGADPFRESAFNANPNVNASSVSGELSVSARPSQRSDRRPLSGLGSVLFPNSRAARQSSQTSQPSSAAALSAPAIPSTSASTSPIYSAPQTRNQPSAGSLPYAPSEIRNGSNDFPLRSAPSAFSAPSRDSLTPARENPAFVPDVREIPTLQTNIDDDKDFPKTSSAASDSSATPVAPFPPIIPSLIESPSASSVENSSENSVENPTENSAENLSTPSALLPTNARQNNASSQSESDIPLVGPNQSPTSAHTGSSDSGAAEQTGIERILANGTTLEQKKDWNLALNYWEKYLKQFPEDAQLQARHRIARIHYDIAHRMADPAYLQMLQTLTPGQSRTILIEVLNKLHTYYVDRLTWEFVCQSGLGEIEIALSDENFRAAFLSGFPAEQLDAFRDRWLQEFSLDGQITGEKAIQCAAWFGYKGKADLKIPESVLILEFLCGITNSLDVYSTFLTPTQLNDLFNQIEGNFVGLGVELKDSNGLLRIIRTIQGSPAQQAGLLSGDIILSVDGKRTTDYSVDKCANMLQGVEGSLVCLEINRTGESKPRTVYIVRKHIDVASVENVHILDGGAYIGYIKINNFQKSTVEELDQALATLNRLGMKQLIIDLRDNPGGLLQSAVEVSNRFINNGIIVSTRGKNSQEDKIFSATTEHTWSVPLSLLIDRNSASAAEIFAGAMRDHNRAQIIGARSYGKGSVQGIFPLTTCDAGVRLTTAKFYSPLGKPFAQIGVQPSLEVRIAARPVDKQTGIDAASTELYNNSSVSLEGANDEMADDSDFWAAVPEKDDACIQAAVEAFAHRQNSLSL